MTTAREILRQVMAVTGTSQAGLARWSGVRQPSISQYLAGGIEMSDEMVDRLLGCMGYRLEVIRHATQAELGRSERLSWLLHRQLATHLSPQSLHEWTPQVVANLRRLRRETQGEPHRRHLDQWQQLVNQQDLAGLRRAMTSVDLWGQLMREVSPLGGLLPAPEREQVVEMMHEQEEIHP